MTALAARAWLEALGLEPRLPDGRFFEDLFLRFQRRVACETLTRPAGDPAAFDAEAFAAEWPEEERGVAGEERALAFAWLAGELGFSCKLVNAFCSRPWATAARDGPGRSEGDGGLPSKVNGGVAHRSVVADPHGRRVLADAGFPLPVLLPLDPAPSSPSPLTFEEIPSSFGSLRVDAAAEERRILCDARGEVAELLRLPGEPGTAGARGSTPRAPAPSATRVLDDRVVHWENGRVTVLDAWSVLTYPLASSERAALEALFALSLEGIDLPDVPAADGAAVLSVFHALAIPPEDARRDLVLSDPPDSVVASRTVDVWPSSDGSRLVSRAVLKPVPPQGPGESVRRTLVFHLAMELLGAGGAGHGAPR